MDAQLLKVLSRILVIAIFFSTLLCVVKLKGDARAATTQTVERLSVLHATTLPTSNEKFQAELNKGILEMVDAYKRHADTPARLRALANWYDRSGITKGTTDDIIQQAFIMFRDFRRSDEIRAILLSEFLKGPLEISAGSYAISLTRYLDYPDADVRDAALQMMDAEGVFALVQSYEGSGFDVIESVLPDPFGRDQLPAPFLEVMMDKDAVETWYDMDIHTPPYEGRIETMEESQAHGAEQAQMEQFVFELRHNDYPYDGPKNEKVQTILPELLKSHFWYSRLMVAHMLKHHPQYMTKEIMASLSDDSCKAVRDLTKLISGDPKISSEGEVWPDDAKQKH